VTKRPSRCLLHQEYRKMRAFFLSVPRLGARMGNPLPNSSSRFSRTRASPHPHQTLPTLPYPHALSLTPCAISAISTYSRITRRDPLDAQQACANLVKSKPNFDAECPSSPRSENSRKTCAITFQPRAIPSLSRPMSCLPCSRTKLPIGTSDSSRNSIT
jgi:hypothetical protein